MSNTRGGTRGDRRDEHDSLIQRNSAKNGVQLKFKNIWIKSIPPKKSEIKPKDIIKGVEGAVNPGQFLAIIGASGAGKTTLLNYLSGREISKNLNKTGDIYINNIEKSKIERYSSFIAYVQQDDILFQTLTVRECLLFAARLKLKGSEQEKEDRVDTLIRKLRLTKCQNTKIGGPLIKGVSGGERKRTSIGVEIITDPMMIFLDEPTTGLDSYTASVLVEIFKELTNEGKTIICTIHQPTSEIFANFDQLMLLVEGKIIYYNESKLAVDYFAKIKEDVPNGKNFACPEHSNPADFFMDMMTKDTLPYKESNDPKELEENLKERDERFQHRVDQFVEAYEESNLKCRIDEPPFNQDFGEIDIYSHLKTTPWMFQFQILFNRNVLNTLRLPHTSYVKIIITILMALVTIGSFHSLDGSAQGTATRNGGLFFILISNAFFTVQSFILVFPDERPVFLREINNGMYECSSYFLAKVTSEVPMNVILPTIFCIMVYWSISLNTSHGYNFLIFWITVILSNFATSAYALCMGVCVADKQLAVGFTPILLVPMSLFTGFLVNRDQIPVYFIEFHYMSIYTYGYTCLMLNEYEDNDDVDCLHLNRTDPGYCDPINNLDADIDRLTCIVILSIIFIGFYFVAFLLLRSFSTKYE